MTAERLKTRVAGWMTLEPRVDAWASYGALGFACLACLALLALGPF